jgi:RNA polymerase sigma-70 factor (ECF subfamily)
MRPLDYSRTSLSLLSGLRAQESEAWRRLVHLYGPLVFSWCRRYDLQPADAEDLTQEVFRVVFNRIGDFRKDAEQGSFRGWLLGITRNKIREHRRNLASEPQAKGGTEGTSNLEETPFEELDRGGSTEATAFYHRAFDLIRGEFEENTWRAFWLVVCENRRAADVAEILGMSVNSVYLAKSRVLKVLRQALGDQAED